MIRIKKVLCVLGKKELTSILVTQADNSNKSLGDFRYGLSIIIFYLVCTTAYHGYFDGVENITF